MNSHVSELVVELEGAEQGQIRARTQEVFFPRSILDEDFAVLLESLAEHCAADLPTTRSSALRIATEILHLVNAESVVVDPSCDSLLRSWAQRLITLVMRHLAEVSLDHYNSGVTVLYWLGVLNAPIKETADVAVVRRRLEEYVRLPQRSPCGLAAAVSLARLSIRTRMPDSAMSVLREFLSGPSLPGDDVSVVLGDARSAVRVAMDGLPEQLTLFVKSCESKNTLARFQNVGQCVRLMEDWRDFPDRVVPPVAALLWDRAAPVRAAAVGALYRAGRAASGHLNEVSELFHDPVAEISGHSPERLMAMLRAEALATLVAFEHPNVVEGLQSYLAEPYGNVSLGSVVADARFCASEIHGVIANRLRAVRYPSAQVDVIRDLSALLDGLAAWGRVAEIFVPELAALLRAEVAESAVLKVISGLGPKIAELEDLLLVQLRSPRATPAGRASAASALVQSSLDSATEALTVLASMLDRSDTASAVVTSLAELEWSQQLRKRSLPMSQAERLVAESPSQNIRASAARVLWQSGRREPVLVEALLQGVGPCPAGVRCVEWLADMGELAVPHYSVLFELSKSRRRPQCKHVSERVVAADERYQAALARALAAIPEA